MATLDEILDTMPDEAEDVHEYLIIDAAARRILVPEAEMIFGVEDDREAERKFFRCPRYVGDDLDLADMFLTVYFRNANGDEDGYLVDDVAVDGDDITFSWLLSEKVTAYPGEIQFSVCATRTKDGTTPDWNTTWATGTVLEGLGHVELGDVEEQTSDVVTQLREEIKNSTAAVEAAGASQIDAVEAAGANAAQEAKAAVEAKGAATLASIPADYTALAGTVEGLTRSRAAAIVCEAEGTAIQVQDASNDPLIGLRIFGRSTQNGTPTPDAPVEIVSAKAPVVTVCGKNLAKANRDGELSSKGITLKQTAGSSQLKVNGTATSAMSITAMRGIHLPAGEYAATVQGLNIINDAYDRLYITDADENVLINYVTAAKPLTFKIEKPTVCAITIIFAEGSAYANASVNIQLELGNTATDYEPYKAQTLTVTTPDGLPGIPVDSGGNYTDANGQQWIADEVDLARGVYVQRIYSVKFSDFSGSSMHTVRNGFTEGCLNQRMSFTETQRSLCSHFEHIVSGDVERFAVLTNGGVYFNIRGEYSLEDWRATMEQLSPTIHVILATPVEHDLTDAEVQTFRALHSCKPTTTVLNDTGAHMVLEYAADPKTYIDNKLAALIAGNN